MHLKFRNVNDAFENLVRGIHDKSIPTIKQESRYGDVLRIPEPVIVTYLQPRERVLFNRKRKANPFFHLFESLHMLAGRNDVAPLKHYISNFDRFSDDGNTVWDAYGYRWRNWFGWDQLRAVIKELQDNTNSRRVVLQMWDASNVKCLQGDFGKALSGGVSVPCNVCAMFDIVDSRLNMTVINRSNDLIWGMLGANVVHFSFLQEYIACALGIGLGVYNQVANNLHAYTNNWKPEEWLLEYEKPSSKVYGDPSMTLFRTAVSIFDVEVKTFIDHPFTKYSISFLNTIAKPMCQAFTLHKERKYAEALAVMDGMHYGPDWQRAGRDWLKDRAVEWETRGATEA